MSKKGKKRRIWDTCVGVALLVPTLNQMENPLSLLNVHLGRMVIEGVDAGVLVVLVLKEMASFFLGDDGLGMVE